MGINVQTKPSKKLKLRYHFSTVDTNTFIKTITDKKYNIEKCNDLCDMLVKNQPLKDSVLSKKYETNRKPLLQEKQAKLVSQSKSKTPSKNEIMTIVLGPT